MKTGIKAVPPMILPWLARKAGISEQRAETLWAAAERDAASHVGKKTGPEYWRAAMDHLLELVAAESLHEDAASFGWRPWSRAQARFWSWPVDIVDTVGLAGVRNWRLWSRLLPESCRLHSC